MKVRLEFKIQDCWIGAFWRWNRNEYEKIWEWDVWVCVVPCFPIHFFGWHK